MTFTVTPMDSETNEILGWHFLRPDRRLGYGDGREVRVGETLTWEGELVLCRRGLHASVRAIDALHYAPGPIACRVRLSGAILAPKGGDKVCASTRTVLAMTDASMLLAEWGVWCAERVLPLFEAAYPGDPRPRLALAAKRRWLKGEITDHELAAARAAGWAAARDAARDAAWAAGWAAAEDAARDAAWAAARAAAEDAAEDAAWAAAMAAARAAAMAAARAAARAEQNTELERLLLTAMGAGRLLAPADKSGVIDAD